MVLQTTSRGVRTLATTQSNTIVNAKSGILKKRAKFSKSNRILERKFWKNSKEIKNAHEIFNDLAESQKVP